MADAARSLVPSPLSALARSAGLPQFEKTCGGRHVILIRVGDAESDLATSLAAAFEGTSHTSQELRVLGFHTDAFDPAYFERLEARSLRPQGFDEPALAGWIAVMPCFAAPLAKRPGGSAFGDRITVGRARNQDLVLRAPSVSKLHCWFELAGDTVQIVDAGSTNGTMVNDRTIAPRTPTPVLWGDQIAIGTIECTLAEPAAFWSVLHR